MAAKKKPVQPTAMGPEVIVPADTPKPEGTCNAVTGTHVINGVTHQRRCADKLQEANNGSLKGQLACPTHNWRNFVEKPVRRTQSQKALEQLLGKQANPEKELTQLEVNPTLTGANSKELIDKIIDREIIPPRRSSQVEPRSSSELAETGLGGTIENPLPGIVQAHNEALAAPEHSLDYIGSTGGSNGVPGTNPGRINSHTSTLADYKHWAAANGHHVHFADEPCGITDPVTRTSACSRLRPQSGNTSRHPFVSKLLGSGPEPALGEARNLVIHMDQRTPQQKDFNHPAYVSLTNPIDRLNLTSTTTIPWFPSTGSQSRETTSVGTGLSHIMSMSDQPPSNLRINRRGDKGAVALPSTPEISIPPAEDGRTPGKVASIHPGLLMRQAHGLQAHVGRPQVDCPACVEDSHKEDHGWGMHSLEPEQGCPLC